MIEGDESAGDGEGENIESNVLAFFNDGNGQDKDKGVDKYALVPA